MEPSSPPKRMTRARAAAKANSGTTKIVTAAAKAKAAPSTAMASTRSTAAKRKTRADENEDDEEEDDDDDELVQRVEQAPPPARGRGRPRKAVAEAGDKLAGAGAGAATKATRARAAKKTAIEPSASGSGTVKTGTRGRPRKVVQQDTASDADEISAEPVKKATKARGATTSSSLRATGTTTASRAASTTARGAAANAAAATTTTGKPAVKKTVKFQEPDKENVEPATAKSKTSKSTTTSATTKPGTTTTKTTTTTTGGMRGRPAKRGGAVAAARSGRTATGTTGTDGGERKKPLSPKKVTQIPLARDRDESEDELAGNDSSPVRLQLRKSPVKPMDSITVARSGSTSGTGREKSDSEPEHDTTQEVNAEVLEAGERAILGSPAKRLPSSPFKDTLKSPAKKIGAVPFPGSAMRPTANSAAGQSGQTSPFKNSLLMSAAKRPASPIKGLSVGSAHAADHSHSAMKSSILQSPAKRAVPGLLSRSQQQHIVGTPSMKPLAVSGATPAAESSSRRPSAKLMLEDDQSYESSDDADDELFADPMEALKFPGRLSAVLPRDADPMVQEEAGEEDQVDEVPFGEEGGSLAREDVAVEQDPMEVVAAEAEVNMEPVFEAEELEEAIDAEMHEETSAAAQTTDKENVPEFDDAEPQESPVQPKNTMFELREKDLDPCYDMESDSEADGASPVKNSASPSHRRRTINGEASSPTKKGFDSLAEQLGAWSASTPVKTTVAADNTVEASPAVDESEATPVLAEKTAVVSEFFEEEMSVRSPPASPTKSASFTIEEDAEDNAPVEEPELADMMVTGEDVALAEEANEMSLMESKPSAEEVEGNTSRSFEDSLSEASQEYGDENDVPVDPALLDNSNNNNNNKSEQAPPVTPMRPVSRTFNTTTKIPLKPADESTPSPLKRSYSASRVAPKRPAGIPRSATVISYSPTKESRRRSSAASRRESSIGSAPSTPAAAAAPPVTPSKSDVWSNIGTPARTPRKDLNPALLRGAVVFVDVHTSEGADASGIFVELLGQMGARCLKTWNWNPNEDEESSSSAGKVGITHVVYKDGGKRTLQKVREANGVVQCVGVSWVLDCERENQWLDEAPYYIDTSLVPRGGARRRKSMEPKALSNLNGTIVSSPSKGSLPRDGQLVPNTPINRRESTLWMHTPSDQDENENPDDVDDDGIEWSKILLTPVPKTPAPEAVAQYAANIPIPETPGVGDEDWDGGGGSEDYSPSKEAMLTRTCPPKKTGGRGGGIFGVDENMGDGILGRDKDEQVLMRLMAARRKSLQFAPKIGSPLSRTWQ